MDPFRLCLAVGPIAVYLMLLGGIHLARRPFIVSGTRDAAALGLALAGLVAVGPLALFFPHDAATRFGPFVWLFLIVFYALCLVLALLLLRPRLVIYNVAADELRPILADLAPQLDSDARWAGDGLILPNMGIQLHMETFLLQRTISLMATGARQNYLGWRRLELSLTAALAAEELPRNVRNARILGGTLLGIGVLLSLLLIFGVAHDPRAVAQGLFEMLRLQK